MASTLDDRVLLNKRALRLQDRGGSVRIDCADGSRYEADHCIVTLPLTALRTLDLELDLDDPVAAAVSGSGYTRVTHGLMRPSEPFWDADGMSPVMWTDTVMG